MSGRRFVMFSAGEGSFRAALVDRRRHPTAEFRLVFTDTLYEDADAYRFLVEAAHYVTGRPYDRGDWPLADQYPDYRVSVDVPIEEYRGNPEWRAFLADIRARAMAALPELTWLVEGRDPWEIYRDRRFLGNSGVDPCSEVAKRIAFADWRSAHCRRVGELFGPPDVFLVGIGEHEKKRFYGDKTSRGILRANADDGWLYEAPLIDTPQVGEETLFYAPVDTFGIEPARLYGLGYIHNNCGGFCCKAGQAHWANRFRVQPERFAYDAMMERKLVAYVGGGHAMMTDRRGGGKTPMTLDDFERRLLLNPKQEFQYRPGESGCGCMGVTA